MDKLEKVLAAEETARQTVAAARERADAIRATAVEDARRTGEEASAKARSHADAEHERMLGTAREEAESIRRDAEERRGAVLGAARGRVDAAVDEITRVLRG